MISVSSFPVLSWEQNNPSWVRAQKLMELIGGGLENYGKLQQARVAPQMAQAELQKKLADIAASQAGAGLTEQEAQWYGPKAQSDIGYQGAQTRNIFSEMGEREALLPSKLSEAKLKEKYPFIAQAGITGDIDRLRFAKDHPEQFGASAGFPGAAEQMQSGNLEDLTYKPSQYAQLANAVNASGGTATLNPQMVAQQQAQRTGFTPVNQANVAAFLGRGGQVPQQPNVVTQALGLGQQAPQQPANIYQALGIGGQPLSQPAAQYTGQLQQQPQSLIDMMQQGIGSSERAKQARAGYFEKQTQTAEYRTLPIDQKSALLAQAAGFGVDPTEATNMFINGATVKDIALRQGFGEDSSKWPDPIYAITKPELARTQQRKAALNELNVLNPILTDALAPYAQRFSGWSPKQISQALSGEDPDAQARFLAAKALIPELATIRVRAAQGGQVGIEIIEKMINSSMGNVKAYQGLVTPEVYKAANRYVDQWLNQSVTAANTANLRWMDKISAAQKEEKLDQKRMQGTKPSLKVFLKAAKQDNPDVAEEDLVSYYNEEYGEE